MNHQPQYLGVDVAGADNTWAAVLEKQEGSLRVVDSRLSTLREVAMLAEDRQVVAAVIDAPLTAALEDERGFRSSDHELRSLLGHPDRRQWVLSINSLMAVPVRGQLLAQSIGSVVGTLLETHPRACLYFACQDDQEREACMTYKSTTPDIGAVATLWRMWSTIFRLQSDRSPEGDGALDAIVCATIGYLFHHELGRLQYLHHDRQCRVGGGPFYVLRPASVSEGSHVRR